MDINASRCLGDTGCKKEVFSHHAHLVESCDELILLQVDAASSAFAGVPHLEHLVAILGDLQ